MTLSSKSPQAAALTPIFVAIAEPQLPEPMSATFSGIFASNTEGVGVGEATSGRSYVMLSTWPRGMLRQPSGNLLRHTRRFDAEADGGARKVAQLLLRF